MCQTRDIGKYIAKELVFLEYSRQIYLWRLWVKSLHIDKATAYCKANILEDIGIQTGDILTVVATTPTARELPVKYTSISSLFFGPRDDGRPGAMYLSDYGFGTNIRDLKPDFKDFLDGEDGKYVCINWHTFMDQHIDPIRVRQIAVFLHKHTDMPVYDAVGKYTFPEEIQTRKKFKSRVFFGEALKNAISDGDTEKTKDLLANGDGTYTERTFSTEAERQAYYQGIADYYGWMGAYVLEDKDKTPSWAKKK